MSGRYNDWVPSWLSCEYPPLRCLAGPGNVRAPTGVMVFERR